MGSKLIAIVGESGSGKSTSIQYLDPKETYVINVAGKELPFRGSSKLYNAENKNYFEPTSIADTSAKLEAISKNAPHIKQIIIDDSNYLQTFNMVAKSMETGYSKFTLLAKDIVNLIQKCKSLRDDLIIYYFTHSEAVFDGDDIINYKIKTIGKMLDNQVVMEGLFTTVLYTYIDCKNNDCKYHFITNRYGKLPAKSPNGMFTELKIDNNLQIVSDTIREYYN